MLPLPRQAEIAFQEFHAGLPVAQADEKDFELIYQPNSNLSGKAWACLHGQPKYSAEQRTNRLSMVKYSQVPKGFSEHVWCVMPQRCASVWEEDRKEI